MPFPSVVERCALPLWSLHAYLIVFFSVVVLKKTLNDIFFISDETRRGRSGTVHFVSKKPNTFSEPAEKNAAVRLFEIAARKTSIASDDETYLRTLQKGRASVHCSQQEDPKLQPADFSDKLTVSS